MAREYHVSIIIERLQDGEAQTVSVDTLAVLDTFLQAEDYTAYIIAQQEHTP